MKYLKEYKETHEPDIRKVGKYVYCKKTLNTELNREEHWIDKEGYNRTTYINTLINFIKGKYYEVVGMYGDPQSAIEKYHINEYLPVECISAIILKDYHNIEYKFKVKYKNKIHKQYKDFFEYFEIPEFTNSIDKYNL